MKTLTYLATAAVALTVTSATFAFDDYLASWSFDEMSGIVATADPSTYDGTVYGAEWGEGIAAGGLVFDNADYVGVPGETGFPAEVGTLTEGSISIWFKTDTASPTESILRPLFFFGSATGPGSGLIVEIGHGHDGSTVLYFTYYDNGSTTQCYDTVVNLQPGEWYHFVAVVGSNFNTGYLNGVELVDRDYNAGTAADHFFMADVADQAALWIGQGYARNFPSPLNYEGTIDEVRLYDYALSATDVAEYYASVLAPSFVRGDCNGDGLFDIGDPVSLLGELFTGTTAGDCDDACDLNDDATIDISDAVTGLSALFAAGTSPADPFPTCGIDPTDDALGCAAYTCP